MTMKASMQNEKDRRLFVPLLLFLWAGYLFFWGVLPDGASRAVFLDFSPVFECCAAIHGRASIGDKHLGCRWAWRALRSDWSVPGSAGRQ